MTNLVKNKKFEIDGFTFW